jgi:hypothetical protein
LESGEGSLKCRNPQKKNLTQQKSNSISIQQNATIRFPNYTKKVPFFFYIFFNYNKIENKHYELREKKIGIFILFSLTETRSWNFFYLLENNIEINFSVSRKKWENCFSLDSWDSEKTRFICGSVWGMSGAGP